LCDEPNLNQRQTVAEPLRADFAFGIGLEVDSLFEQLFRAFDDDWLFDWSFDR
jgi:hypothetical protein